MTLVLGLLRFRIQEASITTNRELLSQSHALKYLLANNATLDDSGVAHVNRDLGHDVVASDTGLESFLRAALIFKLVLNVVPEGESPALHGGIPVIASEGPDLDRVLCAADVDWNTILGDVA